MAAMKSWLQAAPGRLPTVPASPSAASLRTMKLADLDGVMAIEAAVYPFPWSRGNFVDSLAADHLTGLLADEASGSVLGYYVAMAAVDEMHLLNITVAPSAQRLGLARQMLGALAARCSERSARQLWLEVRASNQGAQAAYLRLGFTRVGVRRGYYPAAHGQREDAWIMSLPIGSAGPELG